VPSPSEMEYWDGIAHRVMGNGFTDNIWKRLPQISRLGKYEWVNEKVLEIGHGNGAIAAALQMLLLGNWHYTGTEVSSAFSKWAKEGMRLNSVQADVTELPGSGYTRIIAFDSLEHVRPEDREAGYKRMAEVAAEGCLLFLHYSYSTSHHDKQFDHPFGLEDLVRLEGVGFALRTYERYECQLPQEVMKYAFAVLQK
jgi:SAM-dependent methyltransferase